MFDFELALTMSAGHIGQLAVAKMYSWSRTRGLMGACTAKSETGSDVYYFSDPKYACPNTYTSKFLQREGVGEEVNARQAQRWL
jgi:hypothetical protein